MPGELEAEEESPYLRRRKALSVRRRRFSRRLRWLLLAVLVLVPVTLGGYFLALFALHSPHFLVRSSNDIVVVGNRFVSREEILGALGLPLAGVLKGGTNIFRIPLDVKRKQIESLAWVRSASITRVFPHELLVNVVERTPVAFANIGGHIVLVDASGVLLEKPEAAVFDFPVITGLDGVPNLQERAARVALYEEFMRQLGREVPGAGWMISEVDVQDPEDLKALLVQGHETLQLYLGTRDFAERFQNFLTLLPDLRKSNVKIDSIDLRYRNQVVVNPQTAEPAEEQGTGASSRAQKE